VVAPGSLLDDDVQDPAGSPLQIGQIIAGKYRIDRQIGRGGMGVVLAATHLQLETLVAIKVMRRDLLEDDRALHRLLVEARSAAKIRSEHVARVLDVGTLEGGSPFIVMEYLEGEDLADMLDRQGALEVERAITFMLQSCEALAEVHVAEMVHRDLKPGNLFIARLPDGTATVKIVDFGISKQIGGLSRERAATTSPQVLGSPFYMAPEQMRAEAVDERSDIWALGAILFEMLTGRPPFIADTLPEVYAAVLSGAPPPIDQFRPGVPPGLDDVVQRCLEKDPAQRFCDVADLAEALAPFGGPMSVASVERITRILTNPEPFRARPSTAPTGEGHGTARGGTPPQQVAVDGMPIGARPPGSAVGGTWVESSSRLASDISRASLTPGGFGPLSATGMSPSPEYPRPRRWLAALVTGSVALSVLVGVWVLRAPDTLPIGRPLGGQSSKATGTAAAGRPPGPAEESKALSGDSPSSGAPAVSARPALEVEQHSLQPGSKPKSSISVEGFRAAVGTKKKSSQRTEPAAEAASTTPKARASATPPRATSLLPNEPEPKVIDADDDPWNPKTFGDRR
jgi:eukaryotic-like serine/threonine-protein kinase